MHITYNIHTHSLSYIGDMWFLLKPRKIFSVLQEFFSHSFLKW